MDQNGVSRYSRSVCQSLTFLPCYIMQEKAEITRQGMQVWVVRPMRYRADNEEIYL